MGKWAHCFDSKLAGSYNLLRPGRIQIIVVVPVAAAVAAGKVVAETRKIFVDNTNKCNS